MDRRQQKTRAAIFNAFGALLSEEPYSKITIQEIIDRANIGRSTFYAHFETKDSLLAEMCRELFDHIIEGVLNDNMPSDPHFAPGVRDPVFCHLLQHIKANTNHVHDLLVSESSDIFMRYFKMALTKLISSYVLTDKEPACDVPRPFLLNHITGAFVEMVQWWVRRDMKESPEELDRYFQAVISPLL
ncbi:TetR/AcrR family transcriptional regulator [Dialister sp.]|uniref:TetR/AcrR family transcriptional regulator n=1 Tax=Dialister sp. TaxID=1955814 RepID=UPI002E8092AC|nr:TetR/AcrR family transcriptional regulator [Dialister sp.]MEE3452874.1 TetR/AcrR family transcriptional regulator [Dialister sp.]